MPSCFDDLVHFIKLKPNGLFPEMTGGVMSTVGNKTRPSARSASATLSASHASASRDRVWTRVLFCFTRFHSRPWLPVSCGVRQSRNTPALTPTCINVSPLLLYLLFSLCLHHVPFSVYHVIYSCKCFLLSSESFQLLVLFFYFFKQR